MLIFLLYLSMINVKTNNFDGAKENLVGKYLYYHNEWNLI